MDLCRGSYKQLSLLTEQKLGYICCHCCSVTKSCLTICDPRSCSMPGSTVLNYLLEFAQFMPIESMMLSKHLTLCHPLFILLSVFPNIRIFSKKWSLHQEAKILELQHQSFQWIFRINWFGLTGLISLQTKGLSRVFSNTTIWKHQFIDIQSSLWSNCHIHMWVPGKP